METPKIDVSFKPYMDYRKITNKASKQWELRQLAHTDENGLRKIDYYYCVALGTHYTKECGSKFIITLDSGIVFKVVVSDIKDNKHTDKLNIYTPMKNGNGNMIEFLVDTRKLPRKVKLLGTVSSLNLQGNIVKIEREI